MRGAARAFSTPEAPARLRRIRNPGHADEENADCGGTFFATCRFKWGRHAFRSAPRLFSHGSIRMDTDHRGLVLPRPPAADHAEPMKAEGCFEGGELEPWTSFNAQR